MGKRLLYVLVFLGMGINGFLYLSWYLSPPSPDRISYWLGIYLFVLPYLGILGITALVLKNALRIPWSTGIALLLYVGILTIIANSYKLKLTWLFSLINYELFHAILFFLTLLWLIVLVKK
ncbi:hypothetical protein [Nostoc sp.]|uniref:hypothetical protein n=1 Tax=Nostoc sp. TaxID=1180 RepID=UPI002FF819CE